MPAAFFLTLIDMGLFGIELCSIVIVFCRKILFIVEEPCLLQHRLFVEGPGVGKGSVSLVGQSE